MSNELLKGPVVVLYPAVCGSCDMTGRLLSWDPKPMVVDCIKGGAGYIVLPDEAVSLASVISLFKYVITGYRREVTE